jgi:hypothetical protein
MSQNAREKSNLNHPPISEKMKPEPPIINVSPDDPIDIKPTGTGKPGQRQE